MIKWVINMFVGRGQALDRKLDSSTFYGELYMKRLQVEKGWSILFQTDSFLQSIYIFLF